jgi:hypothetical protein
MVLFAAVLMTWSWSQWVIGLNPRAPQRDNATRGQRNKDGHCIVAVVSLPVFSVQAAGSGARKERALGYRVSDRSPLATKGPARVKPPSWMASHPPTMSSSI